jgi:hypothetical protein
VDADLGVGEGPVDHDLAAPELSRRWSRWTLLAKRVRYVASSSAVSPPPTTAISLSRKKKPSHVAQALTPAAAQALSLSRPSHSADAPVATITASARYSMPRAHSPERPAAREVDPVDVDVERSALPKRSAWARNFCHQLRALDAVGEARVVLDVAGEHQLAARRGAGDDDRLEVGARRVDRGGQAGRAGADDEHLTDRPRYGSIGLNMHARHGHGSLSAPAWLPVVAGIDEMLASPRHIFRPIGTYSGRSVHRVAGWRGAH